MHPEKRAGILLNEECARQVIAYPRVVLMGLCFSLANYLASFSPSDLDQGSPQYACASFSLLWDSTPFLFYPRGVFLCICCQGRSP